MLFKGVFYYKDEFHTLHTQAGSKIEAFFNCVYQLKKKCQSSFRDTLLTLVDTKQWSLEEVFEKVKTPSPEEVTLHENQMFDIPLYQKVRVKKLKGEGKVAFELYVKNLVIEILKSL